MSLNACMSIDSGTVKEALSGGGEATSVHAGGRRRSSGDFDFYSPGDLLSHAQRDTPESSGKKRSVPPLLKRNTIADFANTRAYQESTASLISATDQGLYALTTSSPKLRIIWVLYTEGYTQIVYHPNSFCHPRMRLWQCVRSHLSQCVCLSYSCSNIWKPGPKTSFWCVGTSSEYLSHIYVLVTSDQSQGHRSKRAGYMSLTTGGPPSIERQSCFDTKCGSNWYTSNCQPLDRGYPIDVK